MNFFKNLEIRDKKILFSFLVAILLTFLIDSKFTLFIFELNEPFKSFFHTATKFGDSFYYLIIIVLLFFILRVKKNISPIFKNLYDLNTFVFYNIMLSGIVTQILKHIVGRPRPKMLLSEYQSFDINLLSFNSNFHSFPSGHTSTIFSIVFVFYFLFPVIKKYIISLGIFIAKWVDSSSDITLQTSGSTGAPKTILMSKLAMVNSAIATGTYFKLIPGNLALACLPFDYIAAKMMFVRAYVLGLELDCINPTSNPLETVSKSYDFCAMVPLQLENSIEHLQFINTLIVGGAKLSEGLKTKLKNVSTAIYETFGMTETVSHIAVKNISKSSPLFEVLPSVTVGVDARNCLIINAPHLVSTPIQTNDVVKLHSITTFEWLGRFDTIINSGGINK